MRRPGSVGREEVVLADVDVVDLDCEVCIEFSWMGCWSLTMERRVSAATMPPMEWPIRIVWTEGSMVGEGVLLATSRSMILFWSLVAC